MFGGQHIGFRHCVGIGSTVDLSIQFSCIGTAEGGGWYCTIHTVKIAVHSAEGCCSANTMAHTSNKQQISNSAWLTTQQYILIEFPIHSLLFLIWKFFSAWCKDTWQKFERQVIFRTAVTNRQYKNQTAVSNRQIKDSLQLRNVNTMRGEWSVIVAFIMVKKW